MNVYAKHFVKFLHPSWSTIKPILLTITKRPIVTTFSSVGMLLDLMVFTMINISIVRMVSTSIMPSGIRLSPSGLFIGYTVHKIKSKTQKPRCVDTRKKSVRHIQ